MIVSSATINVEVFSEYFDGCPIVSIDAPMYPVELHYEPPEAEGDPASLLDKIAEIVARAEKKGRPGRHARVPARGAGDQELPAAPRRR